MAFAEVKRMRLSEKKDYYDSEMAGSKSARCFSSRTMGCDQRSGRRMRKITVGALNQEILSILENNGSLKNIERYDKPNAISSDLYMSWNWGWATDTTLTINLNPDYALNKCDPTIWISWSTSRYSPAQADVAALLHCRVTDVAHQIENLLDSTTIIIEEEG